MPPSHIIRTVVKIIKSFVVVPPHSSFHHLRFLGSVYGSLGCQRLDQRNRTAGQAEQAGTDAQEVPPEQEVELLPCAVSEP